MKLMVNATSGRLWRSDTINCAPLASLLFVHVGTWSSGVLPARGTTVRSNDDGGFGAGFCDVAVRLGASAPMTISAPSAIRARNSKLAIIWTGLPQPAR